MKLRKAAFWVACLFVGGCSFQASCGGRTLDSKNAEKLVKNAVMAQTGAADASVSCPSKIKIEKGGRFDCAITVEGVKGVATLEQKDDKTYVEIVSVTGLIVSKGLEQTIAERLAAQSGAKVTTDCGPRVHASTPGDTFRCHAKDDAGVTLDVVVKVKDTAGNVDFDVDKDSIRGVAPPPTEAPPTEAAPTEEPPTEAPTAPPATE